MRRVIERSLALALAVSVLIFAPAFRAQDTDEPTAREMLEAWAAMFEQKIDDDYTIYVQFQIAPDMQMLLVKAEGGRVEVIDGRSRIADMLLVASEEILRDLWNDRMWALTAAGKARYTDEAPLNWLMPSGVRASGASNADALFFAMHFFFRAEPEKILLGEEHARNVHGGLAIPITYDEGVRSAWYILKTGMQLNQPGDTNPFWQAFVVVEGRGVGMIADKEVTLNAGEAYHIPPGAEHFVRNDNQEPLVLIWIAWGEGA